MQEGIIEILSVSKEGPTSHIERESFAKIFGGYIRISHHPGLTPAEVVLLAPQYKGVIATGQDHLFLKALLDGGIQPILFRRYGEWTWKVTRLRSIEYTEETLL